MIRKPLDPSAMTLDAWLDASKELRAARKKLAAASDRRFALPAGSSRAKVTTANARWAIAAEAAMLVGRSTNVVVALVGHYASYETTARVVTGLYRHGDRLDLSATARPIPSKDGPCATGFVWATDGWLILQAGAAEPPRAGRFSQVQIPALEVAR